MRSLVLFVIGLVLGVGGAALIETHTTISIIPDYNLNISYSDFIIILLTSVTVVVSILAIIIALLTFIGWRNIGRTVEDAAKRLITDSVQEGGSLHGAVVHEVHKIMYKDIRPIDTEYKEDNEEERDQ